MARPIVLVSNRGPVSFAEEEGEVVAKRGAGGLIAGLGPLLTDTDARWVAAAMTPGDRAIAEQGVVEAEGFNVRLVAMDPDVYRMAYDVIGNATLWFLHHGIHDLPHRPRFDRSWHQAWHAFRAYNQRFAEVVADDAPDGAAVLVQDFHLSLLAPALIERRPDLRLVHFHHTPFADPDLIRVLPTDARAELLDGLVRHHACGFHTERWARNFRRVVEDLGVAGAGDTVSFVSPLASDPDDIRGTASSAACDDELRWLDGELGERQLIARVDRIELTKNIVRGFLAYDDLLDRHPEWRERVVFGAFVYPSREGLAEYLAYRTEVESAARMVNERWATPDWQPILLDTGDNYPRSVAALRRYDVLLVNPIRDGLNLVATEGPLVNERDGTLLLSTEAGVAELLGEAATLIDPFDIATTADAMHAALAADTATRRTRALGVLAVAEARTPADWLRDQLAAADA